MEENKDDNGAIPVYIVDGSRTPFIKARGAPGPFSAADLAVTAGRPLLGRLATKLDRKNIDEAIVGCVMPAPEEANIARVVSLRLGLGKKVPAWTVQRNCASGMQAIDSAATNIAMGKSKIVLAGGVEAMSRAPLIMREEMVTWLAGWNSSKSYFDKMKMLKGLRPKMFAPIISLLKGLTDHTVGLSMGQTAEILADRFDISREEMDRYSVESHTRLAAAQDEGRITEITPMFDSKGNAYTEDDGIRRDSSVEKLAKLKPVFDKPFGHVTAGNSAQVTDGAAMLLLASEDAVKEFDLPVLAKVVDTKWAGVDPAQMGLGPTHAITQLLTANNKKSEEIDYWEINEAFSTQVLAVLKSFASDEYAKNELGLDRAYAPIPTDRLNVDGGAVAIGHPVGASGARIILRMANLLASHDTKYGVASLCIGGGQGGATLLEKV